ncbi:hypothetical protein HF1_03770 [Mycoplasma haemofelis str. Langford 1]|uniref:Uncharacterized protein n=1 Tax=Mycoplasma haemofelis (strain Langford 1) TaxID=941640 RepID=E8ZGW4_MYCHL|nr:hypothetical protein [Mycoplasma haemofelis]CBY92385.1 hypothetical protein HF1_03770 [Mycoplasma haemofelis str. Langford 1]
MGKGAYLALGTAGAGSLGVGGLVALKPWEESKVVVSIKQKYPLAILDASKDTDIWNKKYSNLSKSSPHHPILKKALSKSKAPNADETGAKELLKSGCSKIYESNVDNPNNFQDFKSLCSKTNEDATKSNAHWIQEETSKSSGNKWDTVLTSLKSHETSNNWILDKTLEELKQAIQGANTFSEDNRNKLKAWCDATRLEVFKGEETEEFRSQEAFCKSN